MPIAMDSDQVIKIPVVDIAGDDETKIAEDLINAAATQGFVYIKNLGQDIPVSILNETFDLSKKFFASPPAEKETCKISENNRGWSGMHTETLDAKSQRVGDFKEAFNIAEFVNSRAQQPLPPSLSTHEKDLLVFFTACHKLCLRILDLFAIGLHIPDSKGPTGTILRLLYYPSIPADADYKPDVDIRAGAHSDYGSITLLFQRPGQPGLEIMTPSGEWAPVAVSPPGTDNDPSPPILVNIGDLLSHWTNGLLKSTVHRVIFPKDAKRGGDDRYSIAFFCHPVGTTILEAIPSNMVKGHGMEVASDASSITADEHLMSRLKATYLSINFEKENEKGGN